MGKNRVQPHTRARAGESMVMVIVMLMVFMILGASVLTAASTTTAAASARVNERQGYYYARSMLDVLDESLRHGELGRVFRTAALKQLIDSNEASVLFTGGDDTPFLTFTPSFSGALAAEEITVGPVTLTCNGRAVAVAGTGEMLTQASIQMRKLDMAFTLTYRGIPTRMHVQYQCTCNVAGYSVAAGTGNWSNTWEIQQVG